MFSVGLHATRVSMTIGLAVSPEFDFGNHDWRISGFFGGFIDLGIQRMIEILQSILRSRCGLV